MNACITLWPSCLNVQATSGHYTWSILMLPMYIAGNKDVSIWRMGMVKDGLGCAWLDHRCTKNELDTEFMIDQKLLVDWSRSTAKCLLHQSMTDGPVRSWKPNTTGWIYNVDCITRLHYTFVYLGKKKKEEVVSTFFLLWFHLVEVST